MRENGINNIEWRRMERKNKIKTLGTERHENSDTLHINKIIIVIIILLFAPKFSFVHARCRIFYYKL